VGAKNIDPNDQQKNFHFFLPRNQKTLNDKIRSPFRRYGSFLRKKKNQRRARKDVHKRYKYTHQKQLLLHQRCPLLFPLPRGERFVPCFFRKENINSIFSSNRTKIGLPESEQEHARREEKHERRGSLFFPPFYDRINDFQTRNRARVLLVFIRAHLFRAAKIAMRGASLRVRLVIIHTSRKEKVFSVLFLLLLSLSLSFLSLWVREVREELFPLSNLFFFLLFGREAQTRERLLSSIIIT
jgi:hypothetical protein